MAVTSVVNETIARPQLLAATEEEALMLVNRWLHRKVGMALNGESATFDLESFCWHLPIHLVYGATGSLGIIADVYLHAEFQTTMKSEVPVPLRMLDYYVGLKRQDVDRRVRQVLLRAVATGINRIGSKERQRETLDFARVLAGLRYDTNLIYRILKEGSMLEESVVYQDILQTGEQRGGQKGERKLALLLLERRFGKLAPKIRKQVEHLPVERIEERCEALLDFKAADELMAWLKKNATIS